MANLAPLFSLKPDKSPVGLNSLNGELRMLNNETVGEGAYAPQSH
jgi:hypothetical protein